MLEKTQGPWNWSLCAAKQQKYEKSAPSEIQTHNFMLASSTSLPIVLCCLLEIKTQLKVYEDEQVFVFFNINKLLCIF